MKLTNEPEKIDGLRKMINDSDYFSSEDNYSDIKNEVEYFLKSNEYLKEFIVKLAEKIEWEYKNQTYKFVIVFLMATKFVNSASKLSKCNMLAPSLFALAGSK